jgi:hypothetical protein
MNMAVNFDAVTGGNFNSSIRLNQQDANTRQDKWKLELEHALFLGHSKSEGEPQRAPHRNTSNSHLAENLLSRERLKQTPLKFEQEQARVPNKPQGEDDRNAHIDAATDLHHEIDKNVESLEKFSDTTISHPRQIPSANSLNIQHSEASSIDAFSTTGVTNPLASGNIVALLATNSTQQEASLASKNAPQTIDTAKATGLTISATENHITVSPKVADTTKDSINYEVKKSPETETSNETTKIRKLFVESRELFAKRLLHIYQNESEVEAWIRDTDLNETQIPLVAHALSKEFASNGARLTSLTVNGKKVQQDRNLGSTNFDEIFSDSNLESPSLQLSSAVKTLPDSSKKGTQ